MTDGLNHLVLCDTVRRCPLGLGLDVEQSCSLLPWLRRSNFTQWFHDRQLGRLTFLLPFG